MQNLSPAVISPGSIQEKPPPTAELPVVPPPGNARPQRGRAGAGPEGQGPAEPWVKLGRLALRHLDRFASVEAKVLSGGDADAVHDLRVASRRLEAVVDLLFPAPQPAEVRKLRRQIKRSRQALSEARDCDALLARTEALLARKRAARRKAWKVIANYLRARRKEAFRRAKRKIRKADLPAVRGELREWLDLGARPGKARLRDGGPLDPAKLTVDRFYARVANAMEQAAQTFEARLRRVEQRPGAVTAHRARIAAKRARYLAEIVRDFGAPESAETVVWFREAQKRLGSQRDFDVLEKAMIAVVARRGFLRDHLDRAFEIERLIVENRRKKKKAQAAFNQLAGEERFRRVQEWMAYVVASPSEALARA
jgi:CHAD domain-containing protein